MRLSWSAGAAILVTGFLSVIAPFAEIPPQPASAHTVSPAHLDTGSHRRLGCVARHFLQANSSHDGRLTLTQAQLDGWSRVVRHFSEIDVAARGYVTLQQVSDYTAAHRRPRHGG